MGKSAESSPLRRRPANGEVNAALGEGFGESAPLRHLALGGGGREMPCRYILRPPFSNYRLHHVEDGTVTIEFKRPWSDGTRQIALALNALIACMAAQFLLPGLTPGMALGCLCGILAQYR